MTIAELAAMEAAMTEGPWRKGVLGDLLVYAPDRLGERSGTLLEMTPRVLSARSDLIGIVALRNHARKLLAVCEAAEAVASLSWVTSITESRHNERMSKMDALRAALSDLEGARKRSPRPRSRIRQ